MTAVGARPPRRTYRDFVRVEGSEATGRFTVVAHPHPIHHATVTREGNQRTGVSWVVRFPTFPGVHPSRVYTTSGIALNEAATAIGKRSGAELMKFSAPQRVAMGQQKCPYQEHGHPRLCGQTADAGTVWCPDHRGGRSRW